MFKKKFLKSFSLIFVVILFCPVILFAQSYEVTTTIDSGNPGGLNTQGDNTNTGWVAIYDSTAAENIWIDAQTIPFDFEFYGTDVTDFKCSLNGLITFDTSVSGSAPDANVSLPTADLPDNTIACFWDEFAVDGSITEKVEVQTFGTEPARQFWIRYAGFEYSTYTYSYFAVVLEETTNSVYLIDCNYYGGGPGSATVGVQLDSTNAVQVDGSPDYVFLGTGGYSDSNNDYYEFFPIGSTLNVAAAPAPADGAVDVSVETDLGWTFAAGTETYDLLLDTVYPPVALAVDNAAVDTGIYDPGTLLNSATYYWQIVGRNSTREEISGRIWSFTTEGAPLALPFTDSFEDGFINWTAEGNVSASQGVPNTGIMAAKYQSSGGLETSSITVRLASETDPVLSFWYNIDDQITNEITVDILEAGATEWTTTIWDMDQSSEEDEYLLAEVDLTAYNTEDGPFKLKLNGTAYKSGWTTNYYIWLDDVEVAVPVEEVPSSYMITTSIDNGNPGGLNMLGDNTNNGWIAIFDDIADSNIWIDAQTIPFDFEFYGTAVTDFKCSLNGLVTFDTSVSGSAPDANVSLPTADLPDNTIACFWDEFAVDGSITEKVEVQTFGTEPARQFWIRYAGFEYSTYTYSYFAVVLEETTNSVYLIDCNYYDGGPGSATVGVQLDSTNAVQLDASPDYVFLGTGGHSETNNDYYEFFPIGSTLNIATDPNPINGTNDVSVDTDLSWTFADGTETYDLILDTVYPPATLAVDNAAADTGIYDPGTLMNSTTYYWQIVGRNSTREEVSGRIWSFTTEKIPLALPFTEYFESGDDNWTLDGSVSVSQGLPHSGVQSARYTASGGMVTSSIISRLEAGTDPMLSFWYLVRNNTTNDITVDIKESGVTEWTTTIWDMPITSPANEYVFVEVDLSAYNTEDGPFWLKFNGRAFQAGYMTYDWVFIDDIGVGAHADLYPVTDLTVDEETGLCTWTAPTDNTPTGYEIYLDGELQETVAGTQYQFTDLINDQTYNAGVVTVYDNGTSVTIEFEFTYVLSLEPPLNLTVNEATGLFTWDAPANRELTGFDVYLDDIFLENVTVTEYQFIDLDEDETYIAGVSAVYDEGTTEILEIEFTYSPVTFYLPENFAVTEAGYATWNEPSGPQTIQVFPLEEDYWTGSTDGTDKTETSLVNVIGGDEELGWMKYDISSIPTGSTITEITFWGYVNDTNWPYWSITPCNDDPVTADAVTLWNNIEGAQGSADCYSYNNEGSAFAPGLYSYLLGGTAIEDMQAALDLGWFAVGCVGRDGGNAYYLILDGWNETNAPYLEISYEGGGTRVASKERSNQISLNENNDNTRDLLGYNVYLDDEFIIYVTETEYLFTDLIPDETYTAGVSTVYDEGESEITEAEFTYIPPTFDPPENLYIDNLGYATWEAPDRFAPITEKHTNIFDSGKRHFNNTRENRDLLGYNVYSDGEFVDFTTDLFWQYEDLNIEQTYTAGVSAVYDEGNSMMINVNFTYQPILPPGDLTAEIQTFNDVLLNWNSPYDRALSLISPRKEKNMLSQKTGKMQDSAHDGNNIDNTRDLSGYKIYKDAEEIAEITDPAILTYTDAGVEPGVNEYYVTAIYDEGESDPSNTTSVDIVLPIPQNVIAVYENPEVIVNWDAITGNRDLTGYNVYRDGLEIATGITETTYSDPGLPVAIYTYNIIAVFDGGWESDQSDDAIVEVDVGVDSNLIPLLTELTGNYPNPFNPTTTINFCLHEDQNVTMNIYNIRGELVHILVSGEFDAGYHHIFWDGRDDSGKITSSGVYFYMMKTGEFAQTKKMILMK